MGRRKCKGGSHLADWTSFFSGGSIAYKWLNYSLWQSRALITLSLSLESLSCLILQVRTLLGCSLEAHVGFVNTRQEGGTHRWYNQETLNRLLKLKGRKEGRKKKKKKELGGMQHWNMSKSITNQQQQCSTSHLATLPLRRDQTSVDCLMLAIKKTAM